MNHIVFDFDGTLEVLKVTALSTLGIPEPLKTLDVPLHQMPGVMLEMKRYYRKAGERLVCGPDKLKSK
ncbi:hypothetical protein B5M42_016045 [Paenibacillus athensensis]|uniref:Uncharacterized protein n=1 Tax=Paenibacillus athensensis TaxID=1967502 RepID=A0A4Y8QA96_9BACL|nr:hypothetical protein [Paenibacillus athensensis]MCD1260324.1 hypothetical protein [Paenibacillus athensensis]